MAIRVECAARPGRGLKQITPRPKLQEVHRSQDLSGLGKTQWRGGYMNPVLILALGTAAPGEAWLRHQLYP